MSITLFILLLCEIIITIFLLENLLTDFSLSLQILVWFVVFCADIILIQEIASLFQAINRPGVLLIIQTILTGAIFAVNLIFRIGFPQIRVHQVKPLVKRVLRFISENKLLSLLILVVGLNILFLGVISIQFPQNVTDVLYNHLSRIGYWMQQGSLSHYHGFTIVGMIYPYNNSLLMLLGIVFLRTARFVGLVQWSAGIMASVAILVIARSFGFGRKSSLVAGLVFLTYPLIIFQSITAQSDLLAASFITIAFAFQISYHRKQKTAFLVMAGLALALALGTNQLSLLAIPGFGALSLYTFIKQKVQKKQILIWCLSILVFTLLVGSYAYIQNFIVYHSPFGPKGMASGIANVSNPQELFPRIGVNSSRLFAQFISCNGLPPVLVDGCTHLKMRILPGVLSSKIQLPIFLYTPIQFNLSTPDINSAESAWYGPLSWIFLLSSIIGMLVFSVRKKTGVYFVILFSVIIFIVGMILVKNGWDPYQGRYLITAVSLLSPFVAVLFESKSNINRIFMVVACLLCGSIMLYSTFNNDSLPLISKEMFTRVEKWGKENNQVIQKIAYKLKPLATYDQDVWGEPPILIATDSDRQFIGPVEMVDEVLGPRDGLAIASKLIAFPDFLFRGSEVRRPLQAITSGDNVQIDPEINYVLLDPDFNKMSIPGFNIIQTSSDWVLLKRQGQ